MSIFLSFGIREKVQHRVLNWGIIGAIVLRFLFIFFGLKIVNSFSWILYIFGAILIINGIKMMIGKEEERRSFGQQDNKRRKQSAANDGSF